MTNPFFVLTSDENEIIAVIHNPSKHFSKEKCELHKDAIYEKLKESVVRAVEEHYDLKCSDIAIPSDFTDYHKPIDFKVYMGQESEEAFDGTFTLTMAWDY